MVSIPEAWAWPLSLPSDRVVSTAGNEEGDRAPDLKSGALHKAARPPENQPPEDSFYNLHLFAVYDGHGGEAMEEDVSTPSKLLKYSSSSIL